MINVGICSSVLKFTAQSNLIPGVLIRRALSDPTDKQLCNKVHVNPQYAVRHCLLLHLVHIIMIHIHHMWIEREILEVQM